MCISICVSEFIFHNNSIYFIIFYLCVVHVRRHISNKPVLMWTVSAVLAMECSCSKSPELLISLLKWNIQVYIYIDMANPYLCHVSYLFISFFKKFGDGSWRFMFINFQVFIPSPSIDKSLIIRSSPLRPLRSISWWSRRPCRKQPGIGRRKFSRQSMSMGYQHPFIIH